jgi:MarR family transcriptional regulator, transcriptional regulator for hemolysin
MTDTHTTVNPLKLMGRAHRTFARIADARLRQLGLATSQLPVLMALKKNKALTQSELARIAQVEQPSMAQLLNRMERDDLVKRVPDPNDKRSRLISLTQGASRRMLKGRDIMDATCATALKDFSNAHIDLLTALMQRINANLDGAGEDSDN